MRISYSRRALAQIDEIFVYINKDNPAAARGFLERIDALVSLLGKYPLIGRTTDKASVRVMGMRRYPYLVFYKILLDTDEVRILRVRHMARRPLMRTR